MNTHTVSNSTKSLWGTWGALTLSLLLGNLLLATPAPVGLGNTGSICYLNAVLQCLLQTATTERLLHCPTNPFNANTPAHAFYTFVHTQGKPGAIKSSHAVAEQVKAKLARYQDPNGQQDSCDALRILITSIQEDIKTDATTVKILSGQPLFNSFDFHQAAQIAASRHTNPNHNCYVGPLQPKAGSALTTLLQNYFSPQQTDTVTKQDYFRSTPTTLCVYLPRLMRTSYKPVRDVLNTDRVTFPEVLDLLSISYPIPPEPERSLYQLKGFVVFMGGTKGGHYVAYVKHGEIWYLCNDTQVSVVKPDFSHPGATLLFYELISHQPASRLAIAQQAPQEQPQAAAPAHLHKTPWWKRCVQSLKHPQTWFGIAGAVLLTLIIGDRTGTF
jgi:hypothetical protein